MPAAKFGKRGIIRRRPFDIYGEGGAEEFAGKRLLPVFCKKKYKKYGSDR